MIKEIKSIHNQDIKDIHKLKQKKYRLKTSQFLVEGEHLIQEAYQAGFLRLVLWMKDETYKDIKTYKVSQDIINYLSDVQANQGLIGVCDFVGKTDLSGHSLLLDGIQDPGNMGTLLRSAVAFGFDTVVLEKCVDIYNPKVIRASQGAIFKLAFINQNLLAYMADNQHMEFIATDVRAETGSIDVSTNRLGLILGNEGAGVRPELLEKADRNIKISMKNTESLNVAVAGSILMYTLGGNL